MIRVRYVIRNGMTGTYIYKSLFKIMKFGTCSEALDYIKRRKLNRDIYFVEVRK